MKYFFSNVVEADENLVPWRRRRPFRSFGSSKSSPLLIKKNNIDFTVINAENATSGMGLNVKHAKELLDVGADCITLGDHAFDQKEMLSFIEEESRILRPLNFSKTAPKLIKI